MGGWSIPFVGNMACEVATMDGRRAPKRRQYRSAASHCCRLVDGRPATQLYFLGGSSPRISGALDPQSRSRTRSLGQRLRA